EEGARPTVPVIVTATAGSAPPALRPPVVRFLPKPFALTALLESVRAAVGQKGPEGASDRKGAAVYSELFIASAVGTPHDPVHNPAEPPPPRADRRGARPDAGGPGPDAEPRGPAPRRGRRTRPRGDRVRIPARHRGPRPCAGRRPPRSRPQLLPEAGRA